MNLENKLRVYYNSIIRPDLQLKLDYDNTMQTICLNQIAVRCHASYESIKTVALALETICAQRLTSSESSISVRKHRTHSFATYNARNRSSQLYNCVVVCSLRLRTMHYFLEKLVTVLCFNDYAVHIQHNTINLTLKASVLRLFPEVQNHIELFEHVQNVQVTLFTSARTSSETLLFWTSLNQKQF